MAQKRRINPHQVLKNTYSGGVLLAHRAVDVTGMICTMRCQTDAARISVGPETPLALSLIMVLCTKARWPRAVRFTAGAAVMSTRLWQWVARRDGDACPLFHGRLAAA